MSVSSDYPHHLSYVDHVSRAPMLNLCPTLIRKSQPNILAIDRFMPSANTRSQCRK